MGKFHAVFQIKAMKGLTADALTVITNFIDAVDPKGVIERIKSVYGEDLVHIVSIEEHDADEL